MSEKRSRKQADRTAEQVAALKFYNEHPDQAIDNLRIPGRITNLRKALRGYMTVRDIGSKEMAASIRKRPRQWARKEYRGHVSKTFNDANIRDFLSSRSNLRMSSRLLVHIFLWTSLESYRQSWGEFSKSEPIEK